MAANSALYHGVDAAGAQRRRVARSAHAGLDRLTLLSRSWLMPLGREADCARPDAGA